MLGLLVCLLSMASAQQITIQPQFGHTEWIQALAVSPSGELIASGDRTRTNIWSAESGRLLRSHLGGGSPRFVGEDTLLVQGEGGARLVSVDTGLSVPYEAPPESTVLFAPDGDGILTRHRTRDFWRMEMTTDELGPTVRGPRRPKQTPALSDDGHVVAVGSARKVAVLDLSSGTRAAFPPGSYALAPSGDQLVVATRRGLAAYDVDRGRKLWSVNGADDYPMVVTADGTVVVRSDDRVCFRSVGAGELLGCRTDLGGSATELRGKDRLVFHERGEITITDTRGNVLRRLDAEAYPPGAAALGPHGTHLYVGDDGGNLVRWSLDELAAERTIPRRPYPNAPVQQLDPDAVMAGLRAMATPWMVNDDADWIPRALLEATAQAGVVLHAAASARAVDVSPDGRSVVVSYAPRTFPTAVADVRVLDAATGREWARFDDANYPCGSAAFSPDGRLVALGCMDGRVRVWNPSSGEVIADLLQNPKLTGDVHADWLDEGTLIVASRNHAEAWSLGGEQRWSRRWGAMDMNGVAVGGGKVLLFGQGESDDGKALGYAEILDAATGAIVGRHYGHSSPALSGAISGDGTLAATGEESGKVRVWGTEGETQGAQVFDALTGPVTVLALSGTDEIFAGGPTDPVSLLRDDLENRVELFSSSTGEWLVWSPRGWFDASRRGGDLVAVVQGMDAYGIEQFAASSNRPDLLLDSVGRGTPDQLATYRRLWQKRAGTQPSTVDPMADLPVVRILDNKQDHGHVSLRFEVTPRALPVARYDLYLNGVRVGGGSLPDAKRGVVLEEEVLLDPGTNQVEVSATTTTGVESLRAITQVSNGEGGGGAIWVAAIGVSNYADDELDLRWAHKDAQDLAAAFASLGNGEPVHVRTWVDAEVNVGVLNEVEAFLSAAGPRDLVVVFAAGHGMYDEERRETYYFLPHGADRKDLARTSITYGAFDEVFEGLTARRRVLLIDTCESGTQDEDATASVSSEAGSTVRRGVRTAYGGRPRWVGTRERYIYLPLERGTGAVVFSSSRGNEPSLEDNDMQNGLFTEALLRALTTTDADQNGDGVLSVRELHLFVADWVAVESLEMQHPSIDRDNPLLDLALPVR